MGNTVSKIISLILFISMVVSTSVSAKTVYLSWDPSPTPDVAGYKIYYKNASSNLPLDGIEANEGVSPIDAGNSLSANLTGLTDSEIHYIAVTAYDTSGYESSYSNMVTSSAVVVNTNHAPVLIPIGPKSVIEGSSFSFVINASDFDSDSLTYNASNLPAGASFNTSTRTFNWAPTYTQSGSYSVNFSVNDGSLSDSETVVITVGNVNQAPVLSSIGSKATSETNELIFVINGSDADRDSLSYSASSLPNGAKFDASSRTFSWTPSSSQSGNYVVSFSVSDGNLSDSEMVAINVDNINQTPVFAPMGSKTVAENNSLSFLVSASDPDGDSLTYSVSGLPIGASFNTSTQTFSWTPGSSQSGNYVVTFNVSDGNLNDSAMVVVNVENANQAPVLSPIGSKVVVENKSLNFTISATDADGDNMTYSANSLPSGANFDTSNHTFSWTPNSTQSGNYVVTFNVSDGSSSDSETVTINVDNSNQAPILSNIGSKSIVENSALNFTINAGDPDGDSLTYSASSLPNGSTFSSADKSFTWVPNNSQAGSYDVIFSVSDGSLSDVETVTITVENNTSLDSDGDGFADSDDAFPQDAEEWIDTDQDGVGNNADSDDDNDGISDEADSSPLDSSISAWTISAVAGEGGSISPAGNSLLAYGGAQTYSINAAAGYSISDILVDDISVGPVGEYVFVAVDSHHKIEALFQPVNDGLSFVATETGLPGVDRADGGDDSNNYVDGIPKGDLDYIFRVVLQDTNSGNLPNVMLILNGYAYQMSHEGGNVGSGAIYAFKTRLGPAASQKFHFETRDETGNILVRFPAESELEGPQVELMDGKNVVGVPGNIISEQLGSTESLGSSLSYRWIPSEKRNGSYQRVDSSGHVTAGEGYVIKRTNLIVLPSMEFFGEVSETIYEISVKTGWNLIGNPFGGNVPLSDLLFKTGSSSAMSWEDAVTTLQVVDGAYYYAGKDWGNKNIFESNDGERGAILVPRVGYWIYVNSESESASLVVPKPQQ